MPSDNKELLTDKAVEFSPAALSVSLAAGGAVSHHDLKAARTHAINILERLPEPSFVHLKKLTPSESAFLFDYLRFDLRLNEKLERLLTTLRCSLLKHVAQGRQLDGFELDCAAALAIFCFAKEYVFFETQEETAAIKGLSLYSGPDQIAAIGCYRPLHKLHEPLWLLDGERPRQIFSDMLESQLAEPVEEREIARSIRSLGPITNAVSRDVREMYEQNPYPRWTRLPPQQPVPGAQPRRVLIAGSGSGQYPILFAQSHPTSSIMALDLSLASLAHGTRHARKLGIENIEFVHGDILDLKGSDLSFDFISCHGVLHHMEHPDQGLHALADVLHQRGIIELGLYSDAARQPLVPAMQFRERRGFPPTPEGVRSFRRAIFDLPPSNAARQAASFNDFYTISGCRDAFFHVQEHRLSFPEIEKLLEGADLHCAEIVASPVVMAKFRQLFPGGHEADLKLWHAFEARYPSAFISMYNIAATKRPLM